jgi:hypothetical protein
MKTILAITDLTRMNRGRVCIAGYDREQRCIRPQLPPPGIPESALELNGQAIIYPFAVIELDLLEARPQAPHTEDFNYDPYSVQFVRPVTDRMKVLTWSLHESVAAIFELPILSDFGFYVKSCQGPRSLGTIRPRVIIKVFYGPDDVKGAWDYRLHFYDGAGVFYRLKIVDLTWHYYCDSLRSSGMEPAEIAAILTESLRTRKVYLRIGLSRGWKEYPDRCFLQVTAIHTFPDYLEGKTFLDLRPHEPLRSNGTHGIREPLGEYETDQESPL